MALRGCMSTIKHIFMKLFLLVISVLLSMYSCTSNKKIAKSFYFVEPFKEQEIKLFLNYDSSFKFQDLTGCNQFEFTGRYKMMIDSTSTYLIFDSVKFESGKSNFNSRLIFSIRNGDTAWVINAERISIHKQPFKATSNININLQEIRYKKLKEYYIDYLGREGFIKAFGNSKNMKEAKKRLLECNLPDLKFRQTD